jgi:hypothetical protein
VTFFHFGLESWTGIWLNKPFQVRLGATGLCEAVGQSSLKNLLQLENNISCASVDPLVLVFVDGECISRPARWRLAMLRRTVAAKRLTEISEPKSTG